MYKRQEYGRENTVFVHVTLVPWIIAAAVIILGLSLIHISHSVQTPSAAGGQSGGQPEFIPVLARAAVAAGVDGIFLEVHDDPGNAKSDGANAVNLKDLRPLLESLLAIHAAAQPTVL